jgi:lysine N6-hydroxylase
MSTGNEYDLIGIGIGPFNLSLAALAEPVPGLRALFVDGRDEFRWHPGMLIEGATLQVPFLADLVTLVDPTSRHSFLNFLRTRGRLFPFYFAERFHVTRREYDDYCRWVATSLPTCRFGCPVERVRLRDGRFEVEGPGLQARATNVVLGVGTGPVVPSPLRPLLGRGVIHSADYLATRDQLTRHRDVTVVGSGQSGAEVFLDLLRRRPPGAPLRWMTRSPAFAPMEYSRLGLEHFTPDYTRYFHRLPQAARDRLAPGQWQLHKAISAETMAEIADELYDRTLDGRWPPTTLMPNVAVEGARAGDRIELRCRHREQGAEMRVVTDAVVAATGYEPRRPPCLAPMEAAIEWDDQERYRVDERYRVALRQPSAGALYVQNAELHTHGVGAPDLGLGAHRSAVILHAITGGDIYPLPGRTAFTTFGAST